MYSLLNRCRIRPSVARVGTTCARNADKNRKDDEYGNKKYSQKCNHQRQTICPQSRVRPRECPRQAFSGSAASAIPL